MKRIINATAPTRICDNGGWTDTWFAEYGTIINFAVSPLATVQIEAYDRSETADQVIVHPENFDEPYVRHLGTDWQKHPLIEAAIDMVGVPDDLAIKMNLHSDMPPGASTGSSAAMVVAVIGALDALTPGRFSLYETAMRAFRVETEMLGQQSGNQDQFAAAYGGINMIEIFQYPDASVSPIKIKEDVWWELDQRLSLIYLGKPHSSSAVHSMVISHLEDAGSAEPRLEALRHTAKPARDALLAGDFAGLGDSFKANTEAQRALHPELISPAAQRVIEIASAHKAWGGNVGGAGGNGGSIALLGSGRGSEQRAMIQAIEAENEAWRPIPIRLSKHGLRVWEGRNN